MNVLFSDEMRSCLRHVDGRNRVWRRRGEQHAECCLQPVTAFGGGSVMMYMGGYKSYEQNATCPDRRKFECPPIY